VGRLPRLGAILTARPGQTYLFKLRPPMGLRSACPGEGGHGPPLRGTGTGQDRDGNDTSSESSFFTLVYVVTRESFINILSSRDADLGTPFLSPFHIILVVSLPLLIQRECAHTGPPGQGVSTYRIWPEPGSPRGVSPAEPPCPANASCSPSRVP
jgi:hypothetical protein